MKLKMNVNVKSLFFTFAFIIIWFDLWVNSFIILSSIY